MPLAICTFFAFKFYKKNKISKQIPSILGIMCIFSIITYKIYNMIYSILVNRLLIVPANLKFIYLDFFRTNPKIGLVGTIFNTIFKFSNPYQNVPYQNAISNIYFNKYSMYSNTGFLVEGFARWGYIGLFIIPILLGITLYVIGKGVKRNGFCFTVGIAIFPLMNLNDAYLVPSLTFGGIFLLVIVSLFFDVKCLEIKEINFSKIKLKKIYSRRRNL